MARCPLKITRSKQWSGQTIMLANLSKNRHTVLMAFSRRWMFVVPPIVREECHYCLLFLANSAVDVLIDSRVGCDSPLSTVAACRVRGQGKITCHFLPFQLQYT